VPDGAGDAHKVDECVEPELIIRSLVAREAFRVQLVCLVDHSRAATPRIRHRMHCADQHCGGFGVEQAVDPAHSVDLAPDPQVTLRAECSFGIERARVAEIITSSTCLDAKWVRAKWVSAKWAGIEWVGAERVRRGCCRGLQEQVDSLA
jgi:hypothetical protein